MARCFTFETDCVHSDGESISAMVDASRDITARTFGRYVSIREVNQRLGYTGTGLTVSKDWAVSFSKSRYRGKRCVYVTWSAIEFIWVEG